MREGRPGRPYEKPSVESETVFEALVVFCTWLDPQDDSGCDPAFGGVIQACSPGM